jgi:hypothetical protein
LERALIAHIQRFSSISLVERDSIVSSVKFLREKGFDLKKLSKSVASLRTSEGRIAKKVIERFANAITPVDLRDQAVFEPLDSSFNAQKGILEIYLPDELDAYADHGLVLELLRFDASCDRVKITRTNRDLTIPSEDRLTSLIMGYISELLSNQKIAKISYSRSSYYQQGRMLARAKLIQFAASDLKIPIKFIKIPKRYLGGTHEFQEPESIRVLKQLIAGDIDKIDRLLKNLAAYTYSSDRVAVKSKLDESLFYPFPEFVHLHERHVRVRNKKAKGGKLTSTLQTIKPTKPSTIVTVAPWERDAVAELYDYPWNDMQNLQTEYNDIRAADRDYNQYSQQVTKIINMQWDHKQRVLRKTNHRTILSGLGNETPLWQRLNRVRTVLNEYKTMEACRPEDLLRVINAYDILPAGQCVQDDGFRSTWVAAAKARNLPNDYVSTMRLISEFDRITAITPSEASASK